MIRHRLLGYLLGVRDERRSVKTRLLQDADWRQQVLRPDFEPPRGLAERTCRYVADFRLAAAGDTQEKSRPPAPRSNVAPTSTRADREGIFDPDML